MYWRFIGSFPWNLFEAGSKTDESPTLTQCVDATKNYLKHKSTLTPTVFGQCVDRENHVGTNIGRNVWSRGNK